MPSLPNVEARSRVYGLESALAERAVYLLDKLSRCTLRPYVLTTNSNNLTQAAITDMTLADLRNQAEGPFIVTKIRMFTAASLGASAAGALFSNVSIQIIDQKADVTFFKNTLNLSVFGSLRSNTLYLDRPYVLGKLHGFLVQLTEGNVNGTTDVYIAFHGEVVAGDMTAEEVREAIALGVYPLAGRQTSPWDQVALVGSLFGKRPPRLVGEVDDLLQDLRLRVARLREILRAADYQAYGLGSLTSNLAQNAITPMTREDHRNDQRGPLAIQRMRILTATSLGASAVTAIFSNISLFIKSIDEVYDITDQFTLAPVLVSRADNSLVFEHPHILAFGSPMQTTLREENVDGTTDVDVAYLGEAVRGVSQADLRAAVALGLYPLMERVRN